MWCQDVANGEQQMMSAVTLTMIVVACATLWAVKKLASMAEPAEERSTER